MNEDTWPEGYGLNLPDMCTLDRLRDHGISDSTLSAITGASILQIWHWTKEIHEIPKHYEVKLKRFLDHLESNNHK